MLTELQKKAAHAIVNIFETDHVRGDYGNVTLMEGDTGHLTYGRSQTTLGSGNLYLLIKDYAEAAGARFASELNPYLEQLEDCDTSLDEDLDFRHLLRKAAEDPIMCSVQDAFFDRVYWKPSLSSSSAVGVQEATGVAVVYDSRIHGSWGRVRDLTTSQHGEVGAIGEQAWIRHYVNVRREWLGTHRNAVLHNTVYRMDEFGNLLDGGNWSLALPFRIRGHQIDEESLSREPVRASAQDEGERLLSLRTHHLQGEDVRRVQEALRDAGLELAVDGDFGPRTEAAVREYQNRNDLQVDGKVGPATRASLGL